MASAGTIANGRRWAEVNVRATSAASADAAAAKAFVTKPGIRKEISAKHAADLLFALLSPELYLLLIRDRSWTPAQWERWAYDALRSQLLQNNLSAP